MAFRAPKHHLSEPHQRLMTAATGYGRRGLQRLREGKPVAAWAYYCLASMCTHEIQQQLRAAYAKARGEAAAQEQDLNYAFMVDDPSTVAPLRSMLDTLRTAMRRHAEWTPAERAITAAWKAVAWSNPPALAQRIQAAQAVWRPVVEQYDTGVTHELAKKRIAQLWGEKSATPLGPNEEPCWKCSGFGYLPWYSHYANGVCFNCGGSGREKSTVTVQIIPTTLNTVRVRLEHADAYRTLLNRTDIRDEVNRSTPEIRDWYTKRAGSRTPWASVMRSTGHTLNVPTGAAAELFVPGVGSQAKV